MWHDSDGDPGDLDQNQDLEEAQVKHLFLHVYVHRPKNGMLQGAFQGHI